MFRTPNLRLLRLAGLSLLLLTPLVWAQQDSQPVTLIVRVPADATVEIGGVATRQTGEERRFVSPPLQAGKEYSYSLKATWKEQGKDVVRTRDVSVAPGKEIVVDLRRDEQPKVERTPPTAPAVTKK